MVRNTRKTTSAEPRSLSKMTMTMEMPHISSSGSMVRRSGMWNGPTFTVNTDSISRFCAR